MVGTHRRAAVGLAMEWLAGLKQNPVSLIWRDIAKPLYTP